MLNAKEAFAKTKQYRKEYLQRKIAEAIELGQYQISTYFSFSGDFHKKYDYTLKDAILENAIELKNLGYRVYGEKNQMNVRISWKKYE